MDEDKVLDSEMNTDQENHEEFETEEETTEEAEFSEEDNSDELEKMKAENAKLKAIIKRKNKKAKKSAEKNDADDAEKNTQLSDTLSREETYLIAKGHDLDDLETLNKIASINGVGVLEAEKSIEFDIFKKAKAEKVRRENASLKSKAGYKAHTKKSISDSGLSEEEHKKMYHSIRKG